MSAGPTMSTSGAVLQGFAYGEHIDGVPPLSLGYGLLAQEGGCAWQWLPLCGADFPLQTYAQRGPLVAWTPHQTSVAVKFDRKPAEEAPRQGPRRRGLLAGLAVGGLYAGSSAS